MESGPSVFRCNHTGCGKTFTRKDHLARHSANHSTTNYHCGTCHRPFKRLDLLQRHEKRNICGEEGYNRRRARSFSTTKDSPRRSSSHNGNGTINPHGTDDPQVLPPSDQIWPPIDIASTSFNGFHWPAADWESLWTDVFGSSPVNDTSGIQHPNQNLDLDLGMDMGMGGMNMGFNLAVPPRVQQSAERGVEVSLASPNVLARLQAVFPNVTLNLPLVTEGLSHYWTDIAPSFPFIHRGTFDVETAQENLIMMMIITGSTQLSPRIDYDNTVSSIRGSLVQHCGLDMPPSTLQAFTLCHIYDTWYNTRESQFVAQCMWPVMVAHSRKKGIGVAGRSEHEADQEEAWSLWAKDEERRRAAFCVLLVDTQLSAFWNQHSSRQLSIFAHNLNLPCGRSQWEATTPSEWVKYRNSSGTGGKRKSQHLHHHQKPSFMPGLHPEFSVNNIAEGYSSAILAALACQPPLPLVVDVEHALGVEMVLIGLMAAAWDCRTKGNMGIRFKEGTKHWREMLMNAIIELRKAWEGAVGHLLPCCETRDMRDNFATSIVSVLCDIPMLQIAAGATSVCGSSIGPRQYTDAKRRLRMWYKSEDAFRCLWQCARYLRSSIFADSGIHTPWAAFVTTLVVWAYAWAAAKEDRTDRPFLPSNDSRNLSHALLEQILAQSGRPDNLDAGIGDLLSVVAEKLQGGEQISRENAGLLWRLCGKGR